MKLTYLSFNKYLSGSQNLERVNVERPIFRNFKNATIGIRKDGLLDIGVLPGKMCNRCLTEINRGPD